MVKVKICGITNPQDASMAVKLGADALGFIFATSPRQVTPENVRDIKDGQIKEAHSVAPGLDYPGVGPEHAFLKDSGRATYVSVTDDEALMGFRILSETEGIIPALESAHALAYAAKIAPKMTPDKIIIINLSGRGDKDVSLVAKRVKER